MTKFANLLLQEQDEFLLTCLLRGMTPGGPRNPAAVTVSTHMPLARHDTNTKGTHTDTLDVSTHMPLARHDCFPAF